MAKNVSLMGADYPDVPAVVLPQTGGGNAVFYDIQVIDDLNSQSTTDALSANQGRVLNSKISDPNLYTMILGVSNTSPLITSTISSRKFKNPGVFVVGSIISNGRVLASTIVPLSDFMSGYDNFVRYVTDDNTKITFHFRYVSDTSAEVYITNSAYNGSVYMYATNGNIT